MPRSELDDHDFALRIDPEPLAMDAVRKESAAGKARLVPFVAIAALLRADARNRPAARPPASPPSSVSRSQPSDRTRRRRRCRHSASTRRRVRDRARSCQTPPAARAVPFRSTVTWPSAFIPARSPKPLAQQVGITLPRHPLDDDAEQVRIRRAVAEGAAVRRRPPSGASYDNQAAIPRRAAGQLRVPQHGAPVAGEGALGVEIGFVEVEADSHVQGCRTVASA